MQKLFKSTFQKVENQISQRTGDRQAPLAVSTREPSTLDSPTVDDLLRYRYHHGANIGSVFVLERWLNGSMFLPEAQGGSEFDAVSAYQRQHGLEQTRGKWEEHWRNAITDQQLEWLAVEAKCTSIRLPIGYFTLGP